MGINRKIEQIRQQPEHVRLKYVWFSVTICMLVIILVWIMSTKAAFQKNNVSENFTQLKQSFDTDSVQMPSISDLPEAEGILEQQYQSNPSPQVNVPIQETPEQKNVSDTPSESTPDSTATKENTPGFPTE